MPSLLREEGSTSMATVLAATVVAPKGAPCRVLNSVNMVMLPATI